MPSVDPLIHRCGDSCTSQCELPAANGPERLAALQAISDSNVNADPTIQTILALLQRLLGVHSMALSMMRSDSNLMKQSCGAVPEGCAFKAPGVCFWSLVTQEPQVLIIEDTLLDARTSQNPVVLKPPYLRSYASAPLVTSNRQRIGMLCALHTEPQAFSSEHAAVLCNFAELVMRVLEGRLLQHNPASAVLGGASKRGADAYHQASAVVDTSVPGWEVLHANEAFSALAGSSMQDGRFWEAFEAPPTSGLEACEPQPGQSMTVRPRSRAGFRGVLKATFRPLNTYKLDDAALLVGNPGRQEAVGAEQAGRAEFRGLHFVLLAAKPVARQKRALPFADLRLGTALGVGQYAKVYRGVRGAAGEKVAVKVVHDFDPAALGEDGRPLEAAINGAVEHPNVVRLLDHKLEGGAGRQRLFLLLEYCDRGTLADAVDQGWFREARTPASPPCLRTILTTARQIAQGISHMHAKGVIHGDVSGGNVLLQSGGGEGGDFTAKIADFGLSRWQAHSQRSDLTGSPSYLAPEVLRGDPPTQASDVYSFGVLLYEMLVGKRAWAGMNNFQIMHAVLFMGQSLLPLPPGLPAGLEAAVLRCLDADPQLRCTSAEVLLLLEAEAALLTVAATSLISGTVGSALAPALLKDADAAHEYPASPSLLPGAPAAS